MVIRATPPGHIRRYFVISGDGVSMDATICFLWQRIRFLSIVTEQLLSVSARLRAADAIR
jgi:hypothetical protein